MKDNNYLNRYLHAVGRQLPKKSREDIKLEIRTALEDIFEERGLNSKKESDQPAIEAALKEYGSPEKVAASYMPERWLIGPQLFPTFLFALKIAMLVISAVFLLGFIFSTISNGFSWPAVGHLFENLSGNFFNILGVMVLVFFILEKTGANKANDIEDWKVSDLPKIKDPNQINRNEIIVSSIFTIAGLIILNYFPHWIGIFGSENGEWRVIARLASEFSVHIPWLSVLWALEIALKAEVLRSGTWNKLSRVAEFSLSVFGIFILYRILIGGPILTMEILSYLVKGALLIAFIVSLIELIGQAYRLALSFAAPKPALIAANK